MYVKMTEGLFYVTLLCLHLFKYINSSTMYVYFLIAFMCSEKKNCMFYRDF